MEPTPLHETKTHGTAAFPCTVYRGMIPEFIRSFPLHWHDEFELIYCVRGRVQVTVWGRPYTLCQGSLVVVLPRAVHSIDQWGGEAGEYFNIMFHPALFQGAEEDSCYEKYVLPFFNGEKAIEAFHPADSGFNQAVTPSILSILEHRRESYSTQRREGTDSFKSSVVHPSKTISIDCEAVKCMYNSNYKCHADHVDIKGCGACDCRGTECATFTEK